MAKFVQICASQDDLFALDDEGQVYQHNFNTRTWVRLPSSRSEQEAASVPSARGKERRSHE